MYFVRVFMFARWRICRSNLMLLVFLTIVHNYVLLLMFFIYFYLFCYEISKLPQPITMKICHMVGFCVHFIMQVPKFNGPPKKNCGPKTCKSWGYFTQLQTDREYLWNELRYPKPERHVIDSDCSCVQQKSLVNFGPPTRK